MNQCATFVKYFGKLETGFAASEEEASAICSLRQVTWDTITTTFLSTPAILKNRIPDTIATPLIDPDFAE